jgi:hypothetical protein
MVRSRRLHYFLFCDAVGLADNALLENVPQPWRNTQMALYAVHLASGDTLFCRAIKSATIGNYLRDVANFLARSLDVDARKVDATQSRITPVIQSVLDKALRWEKVPDKREPFTPAMWEHLHSSFATGRNTFSLGPSICNWFGCGLFGGFRLTEWAQEAGASCFTTPLLDDLGIPKAFCLPDLEFRLQNNKRVSLWEAFQPSEALIHRAIVTFTHQKYWEQPRKTDVCSQQQQPTANRVWRRKNDYCHRDQCRHAFNRGRRLRFGPGEACERSTTVVIPFSSRWHLCGPPCSRIHRPANPIPLALEIRCLYGQFA